MQWGRKQLPGNGMMKEGINSTMTKELTGYPSIDRPWLKYYSEQEKSQPLPECTMFRYAFNMNKDNFNNHVRLLLKV